MMILSLLLAALIPLFIAFCLISIVWPTEESIRSTLLLRISLAVGIGFGILSCIYFLQLSLFGPSRIGLVSTEIALLILLVAIFSYRTRSQSKSAPSGRAGEPVPRSGLHLILSVLFYVALISAIVSFLFLSLRRPHGDWDAWAVYNMKARFLFRAGDHWRDLFSQPMMEWANLDYPLLVPMTVAACWTLLGKETLVIPALVAMLFTIATVGIVACYVSAIRGKTQGYLAGLVLVCTAFWIAHGANQYSDIPTGFFFVATIALMGLGDGTTTSDCKFLVLAGLAAGLSAWTKNEGALFLIAVPASRFIVTVPRHGLKLYLRQMYFFAAGLMPILLVIIFFKLTISGHSVLLLPLEEQGPGLIAKLTDFSRYRTILVFFGRLFLSFGDWPGGVVPFLAVYLLLLGIRIEGKQKVSVVGALVALGIMLAGYFMIYVISPWDLGWHLATSVDRLYSQLWPSFILTFFVIVRTPEEALAKNED